MSGTAHATFAPEGTPPPGPTYTIESAEASIPIAER